MAKFTLSFKTENCKGCELCIAACPKGLLELEKACIGCQSCARMCPDCVITIIKND